MKIYYVYRLTCTHAGAVEKYYYGCRSCHGNPVTDDYWSSSRYVAAARARFGPASWTKKVIAIYTSREVALAHEARLHQRLNVKDHPLFFNRANQTSSGFAAPMGPLGSSRSGGTGPLRGPQGQDRRGSSSLLCRNDPGRASPHPDHEGQDWGRAPWPRP